MKINGRGWVMICALALILVACPEPKETEPADTPAETVAPQLLDLPEIIAGKLAVSPGIDKTWPGLISLGERVQKDVARLHGHFLKGEFAEMAELLESRQAVIAGINYEMMRGGDSARFWRSVHSEGAALEIKVAMAYVSNAPGPHPRLPPLEESAIKIPMGEKRYDAIAFVVAEIHVLSKTTNGGPLHNATYIMDWGYCHQWCCIWGDEEDCPPELQASLAR